MPIERMKRMKVKKIVYYFTFLFFSFSVIAQEKPLWADYNLSYFWANSPALQKLPVKELQINGQDVLKISQNISKNSFSMLYKLRNPEASLQEIENAFILTINNDYQLSYALAVAAKVLDLETLDVKDQMEIELERRTQYFLRASLLTFAIQKGLIPANHQGSLQHGNQELFELLKSVVQDQDLNLSFAFDYCDGEFRYTCKILNDNTSKLNLPAWRKVSLYFEKLPENWREFETEIKAQLKTEQKKIYRAWAIRRQIPRLAPELNREASGIISYNEIKDHYDAIKREGMPPLSDRKIYDALLAQVREKYQNAALRLTLFKIMKKYYLTRDFNFCFEDLQADGFLCNEVNQEKIVRTIFPEFHSTSQSIKQSRLDNANDLKKILSLSILNLNRIL